MIRNAFYFLALGVAATAAQAQAQTLLLARDTPVELMATAEVSTDKAMPGQRFKLRVNKPVEIDGKTVIPVGTPAFGEVVAASDAGGLGKSGRLAARLVNLRLGDIDIPLEGETTAKGRGAGSAAVAVIFTGWAGLFHRGNNAKIKAGELLAGFIGEDVMLDISGAAPRRVATSASSEATPAP